MSNNISNGNGNGSGNVIWAVWAVCRETPGYDLHYPFDFYATEEAARVALDRLVSEGRADYVSPVTVK